jgi:hypothetical protein
MPMKAQCGGKIMALPIFNLNTRRGWLVKAIPWPLFSQGSPNNHHRGGWVGSRTALDGYEKRKISDPTRVQTPDSPAHNKLLFTLCYAILTCITGMVLNFLVFHNPLNWGSFINTTKFLLYIHFTIKCLGKIQVSYCDRKSSKCRTVTERVPSVVLWQKEFQVTYCISHKQMTN